MKSPKGILCILILIVSFATSYAGSEDWRIALCISEDPAHQLNVAWRTQEAMQTPRVQLALNYPDPRALQAMHEYAAKLDTVRQYDNSLAFTYSAWMKDLQPATRYVYRVGETDNWSEWLVFETADEQASNFRFLYFGDPQNGILSHVSRAVRAGYRAAPDAAFITMAGDLVTSPDHDALWNEFFQAGGWIFREVPLVPVVGNHGYQDKGKRGTTISPFWRPHFVLPENGVSTLPETNYFFHYQGLLFVVLNSSEDREEQARWLDQTLTREADHWIVVSMHYPFYSTGEGRDGSRIRETFLAVIDKHQVDLVLQGHDHTFGRTVPLRNNQPVGKRKKGTVYINSVSGSKQYHLKPNFPQFFAVTDSSKQFYHVVDVESGQLILSSFSVDDVLVDKVVIQPVKR